MIEDDRAALLAILRGARAGICRAMTAQAVAIEPHDTAMIHDAYAYALSALLSIALLAEFRLENRMSPTMRRLCAEIFSREADPEDAQRRVVELTRQTLAEDWTPYATDLAAEMQSEDDA